MTEKQRELIEKLIDDLGWKGSIYRKAYIDAFFKEAYSFDQLSSKIEKLINHLRNERNKTVINESQSVNVTDLAQYVYCPISFAISKTYKYNNTDEEIIGIQLHDLKLFKKLFIDKDYWLKIEHQEEFEGASIVFNSKECGQFDSSVYKSLEGKKIKGIPDYLLKSNKELLVIEEKFVFSGSLPNSPYANNLVQIQAYIELFQQFDIKRGFLIYWDARSVNKGEIKHKIFKVFRSELAPKKLNEIYLKIKALKQSKRGELMSIQPKEKCINCSVNNICRHKGFNKTQFGLPYLY